MEIILTHKNADFDAIASMLGAWKLYPEAIPILPQRQNQNVVEFLTLYRSALPFVNLEDAILRNIQRIILTDTSYRIDLRGVPDNTPTLIIDHHAVPGELKPHEEWAGERVGATTTLTVERIQRSQIRIKPLEATLMALGIYSDTGMLTYATTTSRDIRAAAWLVDQGADLRTVSRFLVSPLNDDQQDLLDVLLNNLDSRQIHGYNIVIATATVNAYITGINSVTHRLRDFLESSALFVVVAMPEVTQLVCRSTVSAVDVGQITRLFGGGGHTHAAAASIHGRSLVEITERIWEHLNQFVQPALRVADLMSYGVQMLEAKKPIQEVIHSLRRIGHEGYPVVEHDKVVGLLTRRDADRAIEHGLGDLTVREVMMQGEVTLTPEASISDLEQIMVGSGWGQIPIVNQQDKLIGIVTRTDLINHWVRQHPAIMDEPEKLPFQQIKEVLGEDTATLIQSLAQHADKQRETLYMVGGVVRDLLLHRPNLDIDFVVEGDAITFTKTLCQILGGDMHAYKPFGTAKWLLDETVTKKLKIDRLNIPDHIDFATARNEFYEHPSALPTVYRSSIKLDLQRRDFTINTLAVQLSPKGSMWNIRDNYNGIKDLHNGVIRVLHSLSFVDDPTRILRAIRFSERLDFTIDPRTNELIETALPTLRQITGKRLRNELSLLLREDYPERGLYKLNELSALQAIHPAFQISTDLASQFERIRSQKIPWNSNQIDRADLYWHTIMASLSVEDVREVAERLLFGQPTISSFIDTARLVQEADRLIAPEMKVSQIVEYLVDLAEVAYEVVWFLLDDQRIRKVLEQYLTEWQYLKPQSNGNTLKEMGLKPGPQYKIILDTLRAALLDNEIRSKMDEDRLLQKLVEDVKHDGA